MVPSFQGSIIKSYTKFCTVFQFCNVSISVKFDTVTQEAGHCWMEAILSPMLDVLNMPLGNFSTTDVGFCNIHVSLVGPMLISQGFTLFQTCVDEFIHWAVISPLINDWRILSRTRIPEWISFYDVLTQQREAQFSRGVKSTFFMEHTRLSVQRIRITSIKFHLIEWWVASITGWKGSYQVI